MRIRRMAQGALFSALMCILSPLAIPIGPIPVTLGIFVVLLTGLVLEWRQAALAVAVYLLIGVAGLPVFSGGGSGIGVLIGPTGGYLWCYLPMAMMVARFGRTGGRLRALLVSAAALLVCYLSGTWQFTRIMNCSWQEAFAVCVMPFVLFDTVKLILAVLLGDRLRRQLTAAELL